MVRAKESEKEVKGKEIKGKRRNGVKGRRRVERKEGCWVERE